MCLFYGFLYVKLTDPLNVRLSQEEFWGKHTLTNRVVSGTTAELGATIINMWRGRIFSSESVKHRNKSQLQCKQIHLCGEDAADADLRT